MKKLMLIATVVVMAFAANADVVWNWWMENADRQADIAFGIASRCAKVESFEFSLLYGSSPVENGLQWSFFGINDSDKAQLVQLSWWFNRSTETSVQLGMINIAKENIFNLGFINIADKSKIQLGFLNFNKNGLLPIFPFINLDKSLFD